MGFRTGRFFSFAGAAALLMPLMLGLSGCGNFFVCEGKASCPNSGSGSTGNTTGDYAYVSNSSSSQTALSVYDLSTGSPVALSVSPVQINFATDAMVITPNNQYLYASCAANGTIYAFTINSDGSLTNPNGTAAAGSPSALAMDVSPDGKELYSLVQNVDGTYSLQEAAIGTNGNLTNALANPIAATVTAGSASVKVAPNGNFVVVTMGLSGDYVIPLVNDLFTTTSTPATAIPAPSSTTGDFAVTVDDASSPNIYFARTGEVVVYPASSAGVPSSNPVSNSASTDPGDHSIVFASNTAGNYVYTGNIGNLSNNPVVSTISGFSISTSGNLGPLAGSTYTAPQYVAAVGVDKTGKYLVAAGSGSAGVMEYTIGSNGALTVSSTTAATGAYGAEPVVMAITH